MPDDAPVVSETATPTEQPQPVPVTSQAAPVRAEPPQPQRGSAIQDVGLLQQMLTEVRAEAAEHRTKARSEVEARVRAETVLAAERIERQIERIASKAGADPELLLPFLRGSGRLDKLDTADPETLKTALTALVETAVKEKPAFRLERPPASSGEPPTGGEQTRNFTRRQIGAMTAAERTANLDAIQEWQKRGSPGIDG
jgi:hypothetical protein